MNVLLLLPIGLAALAALLLPLLLHLARRSEPRVLPFAALRWLRAAPQPQRRHRLEELLLLLLRLLLLAALALLLAQPVLFGRPDRRPWVAVAPGVDPAAARALVGVRDARWHRLAPGFPEIADDDMEAATTASRASLPSLLRELDAQLPAGTPLTVVVPATIEDADAQRPVLSRAVEWRVSEAGSTTGRQDAGAATSGRRPAANVTTEAPGLQLQVRHAPQREASLPFLRAAGAAWRADAARRQHDGEDPPSKTGTPARQADESARANPVSIAPATDPIEPGIGNLAWLVPGPVPPAVRDWVEDGGQVLLDAEARWPGLAADAPVAWADERGPLVRASRVGRGRVLQLQRALQPAATPVLLDPRFPRHLRELFVEPPPAPRRVAARDYAPRTGAPAWPEQPRPLSPWLVWLVAGLFLLERWVASGPRKTAADGGASP